MIIFNKNVLINKIKKLTKNFTYFENPHWMRVSPWHEYEVISGGWGFISMGKQNYYWRINDLYNNGELEIFEDDNFINDKEKLIFKFKIK